MEKQRKELEKALEKQIRELDEELKQRKELEEKLIRERQKHVKEKEAKTTSCTKMHPNFREFGYADTFSLPRSLFFFSLPCSLFFFNFWRSTDTKPTISK